MSAAFTKVANVVQKTAVVGLLGMVGYHTYQIASKVTQKIQHDTMDSTYFEDVEKKVDEEYETKYGKTDKRDWYDKEDQSFLKNVPRGNKLKEKEGQQ